MSFLNEWASAKTWGSGSHITAGRGKLIVKNLTVSKGHKDPRTFVFEGFVKEASPAVPNSKGEALAPNPVGSTASFVKLMTKKEGEASRAKAALIAIVGPEAETASNEQLATLMAEVMNLDAEGYTKPGTVTLARGLEVEFSTHWQWTKDRSKEILVPTFTHVPLTEAQIRANKALIEGAADGAASAAGAENAA